MAMGEWIDFFALYVGRIVIYVLMGVVALLPLWALAILIGWLMTQHVHARNIWHIGKFYCTARWGRTDIYDLTGLYKDAIREWGQRHGRGGARAMDELHDDMCPFCDQAIEAKVREREARIEAMKGGDAT